MPASKVYKCGICQESVTKTQTSIQCRACKLWLHLTCANISDKHLVLFKEKPQAFSFTCSICNLDSDGDKSLGVEIRSLRASFDDFAKTIAEGNASFKDTMTHVLCEFKKEISGCIKDMKSDIIDCNKLINNIDISTSNKLQALQLENHVLHRRLNRADILISGLPSGLNDLLPPILSLCSFYGINITEMNINNVCYIKKNVLVKFNSVCIRDRVMGEYYKSRSLLVKHLLGGDIETRIYLNDHFSPAASNLNTLCRKLLRLKAIDKYRIINKDLLKAKITMKDGVVVTYDGNECAELLNKSSDA